MAATRSSDLAAQGPVDYTTFGFSRSHGKAQLAPKRIQRRRTRGWRMPPNTVYVGRPSIYGNPFRANEFTGLSPVKAEIAGSNPVGVATAIHRLTAPAY